MKPKGENGASTELSNIRVRDSIMFNFNHLYYFYVTAKLGSVTAAARQLHISQPSLSAQLKVLEQSLAQKLLMRVGRNIGLTDSGELALGACQRLFESAEDLWETLRGGAESNNQRIIVGASNDIERNFVAEVVGKLIQNKPPRIQPLIKMRSDNHSTLLEQLRANLVDVVITNRPTYAGDLVTIAEIKMPVLLAYSSRKARLSGAVISGKDIKEALDRLALNWVLPSQPLRIREEIDQYLEKKHISCKVVFESDSIAPVVRAVSENLGLSLLPKRFISQSTTPTRVLTFGPAEGYWSHTVSLVARDQKNYPALVLELKRAFH
jgi:LysR family transcriptional regulator, transcriptional activator of nhaA